MGAGDQWPVWQHGHGGGGGAAPGGGGQSRGGHRRGYMHTVQYSTVYQRWTQEWLHAYSDPVMPSGGGGEAVRDQQGGPPQHPAGRGRGGAAPGSLLPPGAQCMWHQGRLMLTQDINCTLARAHMADSELVRVCTNVSVPVCRWGWELELQTKVREDFTITEKAP